MLKVRGNIPVLKIFSPDGFNVVKEFKTPRVWLDSFMTKSDAKYAAERCKNMGYQADIIPSYGAKGYPWNVWITPQPVMLKHKKTKV